MQQTLLQSLVKVEYLSIIFKFQSKLFQKLGPRNEIALRPTAAFTIGTITLHVAVQVVKWPPVSEVSDASSSVTMNIFKTRIAQIKLASRLKFFQL